MEESWEERFEAAVLRYGRKLYKKGNIKEVSIGDDEAIMTCRFGKEESYSIVEWEEGRLNIRSSSSNDNLAQAIAIAGLLEIEELLADEDLSLLSGAASESDLEEAQERPARKSAIKKDDSSRMLHLVLDTHYKGLICEAYWIADDGTRSPALRQEDGKPNAEGSSERGRLISLAARARKSHFRYSSEFNGYLLEALHEIPFFIHKVWPLWRKSFSTEERRNVANITESFRDIEFVGKASLSKGGSLDLKWVFDTGNGILNELDTVRILEGQDRPTLVPELGIVRLSQESRDTIAQWKEIEADTKSSGFKPYQLFSLFPDGNEGVQLSPELLKWKNTLLGNRRIDIDLLDILRPYQREGVRWMARLLKNGCHCLLADEMGLGKTLQVISLFREGLGEEKRALIVCPASVVPVWISEIAKFAPNLEALKYEGGGIAGLGDSWQVLVASFAQLRNNVQRIQKREFEFAVIDEAQFIKNPNAKSTRSCFKIKANKRIALTGTPIENRPLDIWPAFNFLMPGLLGSRRNFENRLNTNPGAYKARLRAQIGPFMLRRTKSQVAKDLPEKTIIDLQCSISKTQAAEYARICGQGLERMGDDLGRALKENRFAALSLLTRLRQASCDPHLLPWNESSLEESGKLMSMLEKLIEVLGTGHKVVIFSQFVRFLKRVRELLDVSFPELPIFELTGATKNREEPVNAFQECGESAAMLVSLRAAGTGITLNAADYVFILDPWWNPAVENQAIDRVHRIGQKNAVFVYRLIAKGTIEERIQALQKQKTDLFESLIQDSSLIVDQLAEQVSSLQALLSLASSVTYEGEE